jgi:hypothetical protein
MAAHTQTMHATAPAAGTTAERTRLGLGIVMLSAFITWIVAPRADRLSCVAPGTRTGYQYAVSMEPTSTGELVKVSAGGPELDGIVFDTPSRTKVVVAVVDPGRGPVFRAVHPKMLTERTEEGPDDRALRLLVRRTPTPVRGAARGRMASGRGNPGHARAAMHRTTGK